MGSELSQAAVAKLFADYGPMVYRKALRMLRNPSDAEEATQEVFIRVVRSADRFTGRAAPTTWIYQITTNYCLNQIRDRSRRRELFQEFVGQQLPSSKRSRPNDTTTLRWLLSNADEQQAQAAVYVHLDGMSHGEAAKLLGVSRRTVGNLLERFATWAREQLAHGDSSVELPAVKA